MRPEEDVQLLERARSPFRQAEFDVEALLEPYPVLSSIAACESGRRQFEADGETPLRNRKGSSAIGMFQIMASYHREPALEMGLDIDTLEGNARYAVLLYEQQGTTPWNASRPCWQKRHGERA